MVVKFQSLPVNQELLCHALCAALLKGCMISKNYRTFEVRVDDWPVWLSCMWHAFSVLSAFSFSDEMRRRYTFDVQVDSGACYRVAIWFDEGRGGITYAEVV